MTLYKFIRKHYERVGCLTIVLCLILFGIVSMCMSRHKKEGEGTYFVEGTAFTPTVKWMSDSVYRIYLQRKDSPGTDDYIELRSTEPMVEHFCTTYDDLSIDYNENNPKDLYVSLSDKNLLNIKSDYYNIFLYKIYYNSYDYTYAGELTSYGKKKLSKKFSFQFADTLRYWMQYSWIFTDGDREIDVYLNREEINYHKIKD